MKESEELSVDEVNDAEATAPYAVAELIRSKQDALRIHRVVRGHAALYEVGSFQCERIDDFLQNWDNSSTMPRCADAIGECCDELDVLFCEHNCMMELASVRIPLFAIAIAAKRRGRELSGKT